MGATPVNSKGIPVQAGAATNVPSPTTATALPKDDYVPGGIHHLHPEFRPSTLWTHQSHGSSKFDSLHQKLDSILIDVMIAAFPDETKRTPETKPSLHAQALLSAEFEKAVNAVHLALDTYKTVFHTEPSIPPSKEPGNLVKRLYAFLSSVYQSVETLAKTALNPNPLPLAYYKGYAEVNLSYLAIHLDAFAKLLEHIQKSDEPDDILLYLAERLQGHLLVTPDTLFNPANGPIAQEPTLQKRYLSIDSLLLDFYRLDTHEAAPRYAQNLRKRISDFGHNLYSLLTVFLGTTQLYGRPHLEQSFFEDQMTGIDERLVTLDLERIELENEVELAATLQDTAIIAANTNVALTPPISALIPFALK